MLTKPLAKWAPLVLRVVLGLTLISAALIGQKVIYPGKFVEIVRQMSGNYLPAFFVTIYGYAIPYLELVTGLLLIFGLFTRVTSVVVALMFASYIIGVGVASLPGGVKFLMDPVAKIIPNKDFAYLAMAISLYLTGPGALALDERWK